jgi:UDP-N-acetylmuramoyl-L-alanyl-D-glutamate--2,6-diaminopimelate ligase
MEFYLDSKLDLFRHHLAEGGSAVVNADDASAGAFEAAAKDAGARLVRVSRRRDADAEVVLEEADVTLERSRVRLRLPSGSLEAELPLLGEFNLENLLVATGIAVALGVAPDAIARGVRACPQVPGRMERVGATGPGAPVVLVDYAHTPDAVEKLLRAVRPLTTGRVIAVFGCGGDRDRSKRPKMAEAVARFADLAVLTSDNPRTEDPAAILREVAGGLSSMRRVAPDGLAGADRAYAECGDRRQAIELAIAVARPGDSVVIAGKGHEDYQIIGRERLPFDDRAEARRALQRRAS